MTCTKCNVDKPIEDFPWRNKAKKTRHKTCKACQRAIAQEHYQSNTDYYKNKSKISRPALRLRGKEFIIEYLKRHPCVDCGESDIEVLEFDHIVPLASYKASRVSAMVEHSINRIEQEIDKCEVRCANCHVRRTRRMAGTLRLT